MRTLHAALIVCVFVWLGQAACGDSAGGTDPGPGIDAIQPDAPDAVGADIHGYDPGQRPDADTEPIDPGNGNDAEPSDPGVDATLDSGPPEECSPDGDKRAVDCGGKNGRATLEQTCVQGLWTTTTPCTDPDLCIDDATRVVPCEDGSGGDETQTCVTGRWVYQDDCRPAAACTDQDVREIPCGYNGRGDQSQVCEDGAWQDDGPCVDPDECVDESRTVQGCGIGGIGLLILTCPAGHFVPEPCVMDYTGRVGRTKDLTRTPELPGVGVIRSAGGKAYFDLDMGHLYKEIYVWDPVSNVATPLQPRFIRNGISRNSFGLTVAGDRLFMLRDDGIHGYEAWLTDGTEDGSHFLGDLNPGREGIYQNVMKIQSNTFDGKTYFYGFLEDDWTLFVSPGNGATARPLAKLNPNTGSVGYFGSLGGVEYFNGSDPEYGCNVWRTDGTAAGTYRLNDFIPDSNTGKCPESFTAMGNRLYFAAYDSGGTRELWQTDGTEAGTVKFAAATGATVGTSVWYLMVAGGKLYFRAWDAIGKSELWQTDGTSSGTRRLTLINAGNDALVSNLIEVGENLFFSATSDATGKELWKIPLTGANPQATLIKDIVPGSEGSSIYYPVALDGRLYFAYRLPGGDQIFVSDGTNAGTYALSDQDPRLDGGWDLVRVGDSVIFTIDGPDSGDRVFRLVPGQAATEITLPMRYQGGMTGRPTAVLPDGRLVFVGNETDKVPQPWISDGTNAGTHLISAAAYSSRWENLYHGFSAVGDGAVFTVDSDDYGLELWKTDGTQESTTLLKDIQVGPDGSSPGEMTRVGDRLYLSASTADAGREPWVTDGTEAGTSLLQDINAGTSSSNPEYFAGFPVTKPNKPWTVLFAADTAETSTELFKNAGATTEMVQDICPGDCGSEPRFLVEAGGNVYFSADNGTNGRELWRSDATAAGTEMLRDVVAGDGGAYPDWLVSYTSEGGTAKILYAATDDTSDRELWSSSGPERLTKRLVDLEPKGSSDPADLHVTGDTLLFSAMATSMGRELHLMDLPTGIVSRVDIRAGGAGSDPHGFFSWDDQYTFFSADNGIVGPELWLTDGTVAGTHMVADLNSGPDGSYPWVLGKAGDLLYVQVTMPSLGMQLYVVNLVPQEL